jgi:hypothetical protein
VRTLLISYDVDRSRQRHRRLIDALRREPHCWHYLDTTWLVRTPETASEVGDRLGRFVEGDDELLVIDVTGAETAHRGFSAKAGRWLEDHI